MHELLHKLCQSKAILNKCVFNLDLKELRLSALLQFSGSLFQLDPPVVFVEYGGSTSVNCSTLSCNNVEGMGWESSSGGIGLKEGVSSLELKIDEVKDWLTTPQCYVWVDGVQRIERLPITIYKMPKKVSMPKPRSPMYTTGGSELLQCDVEDVAPADRLVISWYKGNKMIVNRTSEDKSKVPVNESLQASIEVDAADDGAKVWCEATLNLPGQSPAPIILFPLYQDMTSLSTEISLNCSATGNPAPAYRWHFADPTLEGPQKQDEIGPILTSDFKVTGVYSCRASNAVAERTKYFTINKTPGKYITIECTVFLILLFADFVHNFPCCCFPLGSTTGTTAGIVIAVLIVIALIVGSVVYHKKRNSSVPRPESLS
uniref:Ig-like domain-containing protein n=1 Tax=Fundulus heteroclitus TaxID=8078 RepID=A0A3Q2NPJ2_FUNHE